MHEAARVRAHADHDHAVVVDLADRAFEQARLVAVLYEADQRADAQLSRDHGFILEAAPIQILALASGWPATIAWTPSSCWISPSCPLTPQASLTPFLGIGFGHVQDLSLRIQDRFGSSVIRSRRQSGTSRPSPKSTAS